MASPILPTASPHAAAKSGGAASNMSTTTSRADSREPRPGLGPTRLSSNVVMLGIPWDLCERLLGHALPTVARTYDTGSYLEQRRNALENWAAYLERIAGSGAKVVALPDGSV